MIHQQQFFVCLLLLLLSSTPIAGLRFARSFGNQMVLQGGDQQGFTVWGIGTVSAKVDVTISSAHNHNIAHATAKVGDDTIWLVKFPPRTVARGFTNYTITAVSGEERAELKDVLFGDLWVCSGQSNMQFAVSQAFNATKEIAAANNFPYIRVFTVALQQSPTPLQDLGKAPEEPWAPASSHSIGGKPWSYFSATCWFFARDLYKERNYPLGLIATDWGGTPDEAWSSPDALKKCYKNADNTKASSSSVTVGGPHGKSVLWNAMIVPLLRHSIYGAVWYQGEADTRTVSYATHYACTFPTMISSWRSEWYKHTESSTSVSFPFGFVQLSTWNDKDSTEIKEVPTVRWAQTANFGHVPNPKMKNVFMAVAVDLGDPGSPYTDIHPRYKQEVGRRLMLGALAIAYGKTETYWTGPLPQFATRHDQKTVAMGFSNLWKKRLEYKHTDGFELCYSKAMCHNLTTHEGWAAAPIVSHKDAVAYLQVDTKYKEGPYAVRYEWRQAPCHVEKGPKECAVYSGGLPCPPFILDIYNHQA
eukprot:TRINITY_DN65137_c0_g1_i1.p1 TRINITY_DN65137_c0_g1~~TRINITY_DN65137_c0_g1_i1.p1  ORF type:complete len:531 (-),score=48.51 TRINITY_DN65137_c0_g1_i1:29-1621(-)